MIVFESKVPQCKLGHRLNVPPHPVFGRNGIGRFAGFYFADEYLVETWRDGKTHTFRVLRGDTQPLKIELVESGEKAGSGTRVYVEEEWKPEGISPSSSWRAPAGSLCLSIPHPAFPADNSCNRQGWPGTRNGG